jgi:hypothetical protein
VCFLVLFGAVSVLYRAREEQARKLSVILAVSAKFVLVQMIL